MPNLELSVLAQKYSLMSRITNIAKECGMYLESYARPLLRMRPGHQSGIRLLNNAFGSVPYWSLTWPSVI